VSEPGAVALARRCLPVARDSGEARPRRAPRCCRLPTLSQSVPLLVSLV
jgi:hypothetical protein